MKTLIPHHWNIHFIYHSYLPRGYLSEETREGLGVPLFPPAQVVDTRDSSGANKLGFVL